MKHPFWVQTITDLCTIFITSKVVQVLTFNPFMPSGLLYLNSGQVHFQYKGCLVVFYYYHVSYKFLNEANSVDPDQTPRSAASDLGLHYLAVPLLWDARLKWVKYS